MDANPLHIRLNNVDGIIGIRYLDLSDSYNLYNEVYIDFIMQFLRRINIL